MWWTFDQGSTHGRRETRSIQYVRNNHGPATSETGSLLWIVICKSPCVNVVDSGLSHVRSTWLNNAAHLKLPEDRVLDTSSRLVRAPWQASKLFTNYPIRIAFSSKSQMCSDSLSLSTSAAQTGCRSLMTESSRSSTWTMNIVDLSWYERIFGRRDVHFGWALFSASWTRPTSLCARTSGGSLRAWFLTRRLVHAHSYFIRLPQILWGNVGSTPSYEYLCRRDLNYLFSVSPRLDSNDNYIRHAIMLRWFIVG